MTTQQPQFFPLTESALLVHFGNCINEAVNKKIISLFKTLTATPFPGFIDAVPAYSSLTVYYDIVSVKKQGPDSSVFNTVQNYVQHALGSTEPVETRAASIIKTVPVLYNGEDLASIANEKNISAAELIQIHTATAYRVYMIGFLPGFAYMGTLDERIAFPRRASPRTLVPAGSVGIAGHQTGIYPLPSPGGWQLIGQTPLKIFDKEKKQPCFFEAGDNVQFKSITQQEFDLLNEY